MLNVSSESTISLNQAARLLPGFDEAQQAADDRRLAEEAAAEAQRQAAPPRPTVEVLEKKGGDLSGPGWHGRPSGHPRTLRLTLTVTCSEEALDALLTGAATVRSFKVWAVKEDSVPGSPERIVGTVLVDSYSDVTQVEEE